ncbi:hypothetical protein NSA50_01760 [Clostridium sp. DSM 100503]|uniref:hypothetical protein n=1 Tax=Clostridium sp. DSM 100503 TaxID=2963282 RepID=UPI002149EBBF|nr:hypothetical protein [Clostridium sp. DSM 100503]MCR1949782.1 hypothetical protein [Clostridium sp. DSM 100503]
MKETRNIDNFFKLHLNNFNILEKDIISFELKNDKLSLNFDNINYLPTNKISVFLKNIKTREIFKCSSVINDNILSIDLSNLKYFCTDYEYSIIIINEFNNSSTMIYPKYKNNAQNYSIIGSSLNQHIKWFLRLLENGEFRLSTIVLFPNYNNIEENISS